ncbi:MAG: GC-type dockerin domain-anchored protein [Phycisphaerales bacterium]
MQNSFPFLWVVLCVAVLSGGGAVASAQTDELRADQWQALIYDPQSKTRTASSSIEVFLPFEDGYQAAMEDPEFGPLGFFDRASVRGLNILTVHDSSLGPNAITLHLHADTSQDPSQEPPEDRFIGFASSQIGFQYTFRLMKACNLRLTASTHVVISGGGAAQASMELSGPQGLIERLDGAQGEVARSLTLESGVYMLSVRADASCGGDPPISTERVASAIVDLDLRQEPDRSPVEVLDPVRSGWITYNDAARRAWIDAAVPTRFWSGGVEPYGVAADGVTPLLVRWRPETWVEVATLGFPGVPNLGSLLTVDQWNAGPPYEPATFDMITRDSVNLPGYVHANRYVVAVYVPPVSFGAGGYGEYGRFTPRLIDVGAQGWVAGVPGQEEGIQIRLFRPPVVLLHGLEDRPDSWLWALRQDSFRFHVHVADYERTNNVRFRENIFEHQVVSKAVMRAKRLAADEDIAVSQVDIFGHSMGGLLARLWTVQENMYRRRDNLFRGDFHMLVTVNTPHRGSQIACLSVEQDGRLTSYGHQYGYYADLFQGRCTPCGAVADLRPDSDALFELNRSVPSVSVPVHAMYGVGGSADYPPGMEHPYVYRTRRWILGWCDALTMESFFGDEHDAVVTRASQVHGLPPECTQEFQRAEGLHYPVIAEEHENDGPNSWAITLLNSSITDQDGAIAPPFHDNFPAYPFRDSCRPEAVACSRESDTITGIAFTAPTSGQAVVAGSLLHVALILSDQPAEQYTVTLSCLSGRGCRVSAPGPTHEFDIMIPADHLGDVLLTAIADSDSRGVFAAGSVGFVVVPPAPPDAIELVPSGPVVLEHAARTEFLRVMGRFPDGVDRELSDLPGTEFWSDQPDVAAVTSQGKVEARRVGQTMVHARRDGRVCSSPVIVREAPGDWNSDGTIDALDAGAFQAAFTADVADPEYVPPLARAQFVFDFDSDNDVDCDDWTEFRRRWSGPMSPPGLPGCFFCAADFNADGFLNSSDFFDFLTSFFDVQPAADINRDGFVNTQDFFDFVTLLFGGC